MEYTSYQIPVRKRGDVIRLWFIGDTHAGTIACDENKLRETIAEIANTPNNYWLGMGDWCECINYTDKRFDPRILSKWLTTQELDNLVKVQADWIIKEFTPIREKCLGAIFGNHEDSIRLRYHQDIHGYICTSLGIQNLGWSTILNLFIRFDRSKNSQLLKIAAEHGVGGGYYLGGSVNRAIMKTGEKDADIYVSGHVHKKVGTIEVMIGSTNSEHPEPKEIPKAILISGSYLRTYQKGITMYSEKRGYRATALGSPYLDIWLHEINDKTRHYFETRMKLTV